MQHNPDGIVVPPDLEESFLDMSYAVLHAGASPKEALKIAKRFLKMAEEVPAGMNPGLHISGLTSIMIETQQKIAEGVRKHMVNIGRLEKHQNLADLPPFIRRTAFNKVTDVERKAAFTAAVTPRLRAEVMANHKLKRRAVSNRSAKSNVRDL